MSFLQYRSGTSFMHRASVLKKTVFTLLIMISTLVWDDPRYLAGVLVFLLLLSVMIKTISEWPHMALWLSPAIVGIFVLQALFFIPSRSQPIVLFYLIPIGDGLGAVTLNGLIYGLTSVLRFLSVLTTFSIFLMTTSYRDVVNFLRYQLKLPPVLSIVTSLALASIYDVIRIFGVIMEAQKARGLEYEKVNFIEKLKRHLLLLRPCFYNIFMKADQTAIALQIRVPEISESRKLRAKISVTDYLTVLIVAMIILTLICFRFTFSLGILKEFL